MIISIGVFLFFHLWEEVKVFPKPTPCLSFRKADREERNNASIERNFVCQAYDGFYRVIVYLHLYGEDHAFRGRKDTAARKYPCSFAEAFPDFLLLFPYTCGVYTMLCQMFIVSM
jgi:hypothetical protein